MKFLRELMDTKQHSDIDAVLSIKASASTSNALKVGDFNPCKDGDSHNQRICQAIAELNKLIYDLSAENEYKDNSSLIIQATSLRDQLKAELDSKLPDTAPITPSVGRGLEPSIFNNIG